VKASGQLLEPKKISSFYTSPTPKKKRINKFIEIENRHHQYYVIVTFPFLVEK
jgi:hypothetical protein